MASAPEQEIVLRRRTKSHESHGFFSPVEEKFLLPRVRFADPLVSVVQTQTVERYLPAIWTTLRISFWLGAIVSVLGPAILIGSIAIRGVQGCCRVLPHPTAVCNSVWIKPQQSSLQTIVAGKTPLTNILVQLGDLNHMSASLEFVGLPLHTIVTNLTGVLTELDSTMDTEQFRKSENIGYVAAKAHQLVESFSARDNTFRQQISIWEPHGIAELSEMIEELKTATNTSSNLATTIKEIIHHTTPFLSKRSLTYRLVLQYHNLISTTYTTEVKALVLESTETKLALQDLLTQIGQLETQLKTVAPAHADVLTMIRSSTQWALGVISHAETRYKSIYTDLHALSAPLAADIASYDSWWWPSSTGLSGSRMKAMLEMEQKQLAELIAQAIEAQRVMEGLFEGYLEDEQISLDIRYRVEAAAVEGRLLWVLM